jgi:predicted nucleic acid-binding protein
MAGFVAAAIVGSTIIGAESSSNAASTQAKAAERVAKEQSEGAVRVAEIEAETAREAADLQADAFRKAAAELELGILGAAGIESTTPRAPGPVTAAELGDFNQAVASGRFDDAARIAVSLGVAPETVTDYINANLAGLNLPGPRAPGPVTAAELGDFNQAVASGRFDEAARIATAAGVSPEAVTQYINENLTGLNLPGEITQETVSEVMRRVPVGSSMSENVAELMSRARLEGGGIIGGTEIEARAAEDAAKEVARGETEATRLQKIRAEEALKEQRNLLSPYSTAGATALNRLSTGLATGGEFAKPFTLTKRFYRRPRVRFQAVRRPKSTGATVCRQRWANVGRSP